MEKLEPIKAASQFISKHFPDCEVALLAGSVVRGEATTTSDLDIVVFVKNNTAPYRESLVEFGWAIEVFVHDLITYKQYFKSDCQRARPTLPKMVSEGLIIKDEGIMDSIKQEAKELLEKGPEEWTVETIDTKRYFITDALHDFIGSANRAEEIFIANRLAELVSEFVLRTNHKWVGTSKWIVRALKNFDEQFAAQFVEAFDHFYKTGDKNEVIQLIENILEPFGGPLFHGYSAGKGKER
jgi:hypothetical protein